MSHRADALLELETELAGLEERLRDLAYDALRALADGDEGARADERALQRAARAVARARAALRGPADEHAPDP